MLPEGTKDSITNNQCIRTNTYKIMYIYVLGQRVNHFSTYIYVHGSLDKKSGVTCGRTVNH